MGSKDIIRSCQSEQILVDDTTFLSHTSSASSNSSDSASLNELDGPSRTDVEGVSLLKEIFPEESTEELKRIHQERVNRHVATPVQPRLGRTSPSSRFGNRIRQRLPESSSLMRERSENSFIPPEFLRIPPDVAVRRLSNKDCRWHYETVKDLHARAVEQHHCSARASSLRPQHEPDSQQFYYTKVVFRDPIVGLGMNLLEEMNGVIRVHSLNGRSSGASRDFDDLSFGPASRAGILPGDTLVGINGHAFIQSAPSVEGMLQHTLSSLRMSPDPVVLHFLRSASPFMDIQFTPQKLPIDVTRTLSLLDTSDFLDESLSVELSFQLETAFRSTPTVTNLDNNGVHPFARTLVFKTLVKQGAEALSTSRMLGQVTERAREWEAVGSFTISSQRNHESTFVPLMGVRKGLSVWVVNSFLDEGETAYTMWVFDLESCREWFAPVRYFRDFKDLRAATKALHPSIAQLPFPRPPLSIFGSPVRNETHTDRETKCRQLESFLRSLNVMIYREALHSSMAEIAIHVQSFLGCEAVLGSAGLLGMETDDAPNSGTHADHATNVRLSLKRSIQRYTYRLFLLPPLSSTVDAFIGSVRYLAPQLRDIELLEAEGRSVLKLRAIEDLKRIQAFLDQLQEMILAGCTNDFRSIAEREDYDAIHSRILDSANGNDYWERLVREAVREQIEIEVYVPLRGVVSRWLVNGWKREDMDVQFKIRELCKRPEEFFRLSIRDLKRLEPVAAILKKGVGHSTLPSVKLRAIVEAATEISRRTQEDASGRNRGESAMYMGADEFLPIFIYCVVKADMERPCALCILLRTLCDPINRIGETGYYLASFEAAITHLQELDLSEQRDAVQSSFISISLDT